MKWIALSYIVFLHQTTTWLTYCRWYRDCLISSFYIKPQLSSDVTHKCRIVLYRLSTSNHNLQLSSRRIFPLSYIVFLHQTTTYSFIPFSISLLSYIVFLHQTTTSQRSTHGLFPLSYIVFLHQTTTFSAIDTMLDNCLISSFYIKPQPIWAMRCRAANCLISSFYIKPQPASLSHHYRAHCLISSFYIKPQLFCTRVNR